MFKRIIKVFFIFVFMTSPLSVAADNSVESVSEAPIGAFYSANNVLSKAIDNSELKLTIEARLASAEQNLVKEDIAVIQAEIDQLKDYQKEQYQTKLQEIDAKIEEKLQREKEEAERLARQASRGGYASGGYSYSNYAPSYASGAWTPSYGYAYNGQADVDKGGLWEWANGYYAAHNYTAEGQMIASTPGEVCIGGRTYVYDHTEYGSHTEEYIPAHRLNGDGSIWMQTCVNGAGDFMVNRYVPKN